MSKIIKIVLLAIIALLLTGIMIILIYDKDNKYLSIFTYKSELILDKEYNEDIKSFNISSDSSDVIIKKTDSNIVSIKVYGNKRDEITNNVKDNTLYISNDNSINICLFFCFMNSKIEILVPKLQYENLKVKVESGEINLGNIEFNDVDLNSKSGDVRLNKSIKANINLVSGDIDFNDIETGNVYTTSGNITGSIAKDIIAKTVSGNIKISNINNSCQITATSGNIVISNLNIINNSTMKTISGNINIMKSNDIYVEASTISGNINIENNNRFSQIELKASTTSGNIHISK